MKSDTAPRKKWPRVVGGIVGVAALLTGAMGVLHMPFAAPVLRKLFAGAVCPVMKGTPEQIDRAHAIGASAIREGAAATAPSRFALGFELDRTRRADVEAWATKFAIPCGPIAGNENLQRCTNVPTFVLKDSVGLGALEEVTFEFKSSGELVNVQTLRRKLTPEQGAAAATRLEGAAATALGAPSTVGGRPTAEHLSHGVLSTYVAVHTFADYRATISATNLSPTGVMVREEYLSVR